MRITPYDPNKHKTHAETLLTLRNMDYHLSSDLPSYGLIAIEKNVPYAMGFVRRMEGPYAMLDSYISNPMSPYNRRDKCLDIITKKLVEWCEINAITKIVAFSENNAIVKRAQLHGFIKQSDNFKVLYNNLVYSRA